MVAAYRRFQRVCQDFGVPDNQVRVLATEATRLAINSDEFRAEIEKATGWKVELLKKEEEGRVGGMGVASSFDTVKGLVMDLGGGSTQLTWIVSQNGEVKMYEKGSVSMPYGAAALTRRLSRATDRKGKNALQAEIVTALKQAVKIINIPAELNELAASPEGLPLYLSGGGFRGWGFMLISQHDISPYPIPIINGFESSRKRFDDTKEISAAAATLDVFRVSERRASQIPAVAFLINCLMETLPAIKKVHFCQGGLREGALYMMLEPSVRAEHAFVALSRDRAPPSVDALIKLLRGALPNGVPKALSSPLIVAFIQSLFMHSALYKDLRAASALRTTTSGHLAGIHGVSHYDRAALSLMLCERWGGVGATGPSDQDFHSRLLKLVKRETAWWCLFVGRLGAVLGELYPAGLVREGEEPVSLAGHWETRRKKGGSGAVQQIKIRLQLTEDNIGAMSIEGVQDAVKKLEKLGKRKNWPEGEGNKVAFQILNADGETIEGGEEAEDE